MKCKWITLLLALCLIPALTACAPTGDNTAQNDLPSVETMLNERVIKFGPDSVASFTKVVGDRPLIQMDVNRSYPSGGISATILYGTDANDPSQIANDMKQYVDYLIATENFETSNPEGVSYEGGTTMYSLSKDSAEAGKKIVLNLTSGPDGCTVYAMKVSAEQLEGGTTEDLPEDTSSESETV